MKEIKIGNSFQQLFLLGANQLAHLPVEYGPVHQTAGFKQQDWEILTQEEMWSKKQRMQIAAILAEAVSISMIEAGLTPTPLPGCNVAAIICKLVKPCNRMVAAEVAPMSYDAMSATGITAAPQEIMTETWQMKALVTYFSSAEFGALESFAIDKFAEQQAALEEEIV